ncbi:hypothetical protein D915_000618 [Fasciola hepatica]|uniref:Uncharacterized protein n=1 Tax=Fasciola hepatica TaxID=6192 RepID=A0A4E0S391_FASHE|nr:hypothetical protein D915_000618 [Fasciola hepatica]
MVDSVLSGAAVPSTGPTALVSVDRRVRLTDVSVSYVREASIPLERLPSVVVSEKTLPRVSTQIEAMTTSMSLAVPTIDHTTIAVGPDVTDADHCTVCGHRFEPIRLVMVDDVVQTDVLYEVSDTGVGESVLQPMVSKEGVSVSSLICKDESCQTVSHRTTIVSELVESTGSESTSTWVDTLVAVQSGSVPVKGFGVQSDVLRPSGFVVDAGNHFHVRPSLEFSACFGSGVSPAVIIDRLLCCSAVSFVGPSARLRCPNCGYLCSAEDERETDHLPDGTLDDELTVDSALPSYGVGNVIDSLVAVDETGSTSWQPLSFKKTCATQFSFTPDLADVFCQATVHVTDEGTMTPDFTSSAAIVLQNKSVTDYREKLIEHYYYAPAHEASLVADVGIQTTLTESDGAYNISRTEEPSEEEILHLRKRYAKLYTQSLYETELDSGDIRETSCSVDISSPLISPDGRSLKVSATAPSQSLSSSRVSRRPVDVATQWSPSSQLHELIEKFDTLEIWESLHERCSTYESYQVRQDSGFVREQSVCTGHEDTMVADVGVQFTTTPDVHYKPPDSPDLRSASPASFVDTYEHYISRKRMGQLREEQCHATPLVYSNFTQTDTVPVQFSTEFDGLNQFCETVEIYHHRLLRDQVAEAWTQLDTDVAEEMTGGFDDRSLSEEQITEFRQKKRKRVVSQVQITEELSEEPGLMVCELGIQTESGLVDRESEQRLGRDIPSATRDDSLYLRATQAVQTSPITLESVLYSADWRWASEDLQTVLLTGLQATEGLDLRSSAAVRRFEQIIESSQKSVSHRTYYAEPSSKLLVSIGCQTGTIKPPLIDGELDRWTDTTSVYPELVDQGKTAYSSPVDDEIFVRSVSTESTDESKQVSSAAIIVHLRKRTVQYELLESRTHLPDSEWNNIREVASPLTGLFAPVSMAIRRGWIRLGEQNEYVDPATKTAIPLARAYEMGRIRLASPGPSRSAQPSLPILLLIERIYYSWRKTQLVSVVDTARGDVLTPEIALQAGILETTEDEIRFLDTLANTWITIEEGVGRQIIQTDEVDTSTDSVVEDIEEPATCRVFQLTHMCPGGEPGTWITPLEAARLGLFKWETGDVAADWPARPMLRHADPMNEWPIDAFVPTGWCSFLTARHAGWLRLTEMEDPSRWIVTDTQPYQEPNAVLLSTQIKLIAHTSSPANQYVDQFGVPQTGQIPDSTDVYSTGDTVNDYLRYATQLPDSGRNVVLSHRSRSYERDQNSYQEEASQHIYREVISERRIGHGSAEQFYTTDTFDTSESFSPSGLSQ